MPIDTAEKRRSVAGITTGHGVTPNANEDQEWRQQAAWSYSGIIAGISWTPWGDPGIERELDPADWGGAPSVYLEVHGKTSSAANPLRARLFDVTNSAAIVDIATASTTKARVRSVAGALAAGANVYRVEFGGISGFSYTLYDAVLLVDA